MHITNITCSGIMFAVLAMMYHAFSLMAEGKPAKSVMTALLIWGTVALAFMITGIIFSFRSYCKKERKRRDNLVIRRAELRNIN